MARANTKMKREETSSFLFPAPTTFRVPFSFTIEQATRNQFIAKTSGSCDGPAVRIKGERQGGEYDFKNIQKQNDKIIYNKGKTARPRVELGPSVPSLAKNALAYQTKKLKIMHQSIPPGEGGGEGQVELTDA